MTVSLDTLELTPAEFDAAKEAVRHIAHARWLDAGRPAGAELECWLKAEREWIENAYVPHRAVNGARPQRPR